MKESNPKVSIIIAIYNIEKYITQCIDSVIGQDYNNLEIILVDDCSTDSSGKICDDFSKKDSRILVVHHSKNTGISTVRNDGIEFSSGEFIMFVDGDDWLAKDCVSYMLKVITETKSDMTINLVNFTTRNTKQVPYKENEIWTAEKATFELLYPNISIGAWNKIYRRDFLKRNDIRFNPNLYISEGLRFVSDASQRANCVGIGHRKVYYHRLNNPESATTKYDIKKSLAAINANTELKKNLIIKTPHVLNAINHHLWINHFWNIKQILALNLQDTEREELLKSIKYIKENLKDILKNEKSFKNKIKYFLTGMFPVLSAKMRNRAFANKLKKDIRHYEKEN